jgi:MoaA/NifB/PqqE/SkfB family radical SAM enzyme
MAEVGLSSFIISVDAADRMTHERNHGLPGLCAKIAEANRVVAELGLHSTASVTMSRLVDYYALPGFLTSLGFSSVTMSYPLTHLASNFLGYSDGDLVKFTTEEPLEELPWLVRF